MNKVESPLNLSDIIDAEEKAYKVHFDSIVIDTHNDTMMKVVESQTGLPKIDIGKETNFQIDIPKAKAGGLNVAYFAAFSDYEGADYVSIIKSNSKTLALINALHWTVKNNTDTMCIATSVRDIKNAISAGKIAAVPSIEGAYGLDKTNGIELLNQYYDLGVRAIGYVWNSSNALGAGTEGSVDMGLTEIGYEVTKEMNKLGIIIDVSHMNEKTFWDVIKASNAPIIASHSCVSSLRNHVRNLTDEQIIALADIKGVINLNYWWELLGDTEDNSGVKRLVDHIDYIVNLVGVNYVGLGSDFDGATMSNDFETTAELPNITVELIKRGYSRSDIEKILGLNNLRVMNEVEKIAEQNTLKIDQKFNIIPSFEMGEIIEDQYPILTAKVRTEIDTNTDIENFRVIIDGIIHNYEYNKKTEVLSVKIGDLLFKGSFHVVTFEARSASNEVTRETRIFYIE